MAKNKNNQNKNIQNKKNKNAKAIKGIDVIDNVGAVSANEQTGAMPANTNALGAENIDDVVNYKPKNKGKN